MSCLSAGFTSCLGEAEMGFEQAWRGLGSLPCHSAGALDFGAVCVDPEKRVLLVGDVTGKILAKTLHREAK